MKKLITCTALVAAACVNPVEETSSPDLSIKMAKPVQPTPPISVTVLGLLPYSERRNPGAAGLALNNGVSRAETRVAGYTPYGTIRLYPSTWTMASGTTPLATVDPDYGWANGVSDNGVIVGEINIPNAPGSRAFTVTASGPMTYLPLPLGMTSSQAYAISADGVCIAGAASGSGVYSAVLWRNNGVEVVGSGGARAVTNDCLTVVGYGSGGATVWRWNGSAWDAEILPFKDAGVTYGDGRNALAQAYDISPNGEYVAGRRADSLSSYPVVWQRVNGSWVPTDLPGSRGVAMGVDNSGRVVGGGDPATLWTRSSTGTYSAQALPSVTRSTMGQALAINELGQITGRIQTRSGQQAALWTINTVQ